VLLIGSMFDRDDETESASVLSEIARAASVGRTTLMAEVDEPSPEGARQPRGAPSGR